MPAYCKKRSELFTISVFLGSAVSAVVFRYHADEISRYFSLSALHRYINVSLILTYLLPSLVFYLGVYSLNYFLVRLFAKGELYEQRKAILRRLLVATLSNQVVNANPGDLVEEVAWESLKKYWRPN